MPTENQLLVPMISTKATFEELRRETEEAALRVLASGDYILGQETAAFEMEIGEYLGIPHAIGVSSGTEALLVALQDLEIGPGDEVITPCFTFIATATAVQRLGARPVFVDVDEESFQMDPEAALAAITPRTRALIPVHLYGHPAPLSLYLELAASRDPPLPVVEDAAQALGTICRVGDRLLKAGTGGLWGCYSFYPTKNLPACGEAGLMVTTSAEHAERARWLRTHGQDSPYHHRLLGGNARLDALQAAILRVRLRRLEAWNERRRANAALYDRLFTASGLPSQRPEIRLPPRARGEEVANYHQYTLRVPERDELKQYLAARRIQSGVHYPIPLSLQPVFAQLGYGRGAFPRAEALAASVLSLPVHQHLAAADIERVVGAVTDYYRQ